MYNKYDFLQKKLLKYACGDSIKCRCTFKMFDVYVVLARVTSDMSRSHVLCSVAYQIPPRVV